MVSCFFFLFCIPFLLYCLSVEDLSNFYLSLLEHCSSRRLRVTRGEQASQTTLATAVLFSWWSTEINPKKENQDTWNKELCAKLRWEFWRWKCSVWRFYTTSAFLCELCQHQWAYAGTPYVVFMYKFHLTSTKSFIFYILGSV